MGYIYLTICTYFILLYTSVSLLFYMNFCNCQQWRNKDIQSVIKSYWPDAVMPQSHYHNLATTLYLRCWHPRFEEIGCWFWLGATLCHDVLRYCHAIATPGPRYCPVLSRLTRDTGNFSYVVLRYVSLPPRCSLAIATLSHAVPRIWRSKAYHNVSET